MISVPVIIIIATRSRSTRRTTRGSRCCCYGSIRGNWDIEVRANEGSRISTRERSPQLRLRIDGDASEIKRRFSGVGPHRVTFLLSVLRDPDNGAVLECAILTVLREEAASENLSAASSADDVVEDERGCLCIWDRGKMSARTKRVAVRLGFEGREVRNGDHHVAVAGSGIQDPSAEAVQSLIVRGRSAVVEEIVGVVDWSGGGGGCGSGKSCSGNISGDLR